MRQFIDFAGFLLYRSYGSLQTIYGCGQTRVTTSRIMAVRNNPTALYETFLQKTLKNDKIKYFWHESVRMYGGPTSVVTLYRTPDSASGSGSGHWVSLDTQSSRAARAVTRGMSRTPGVTLTQWHREQIEQGSADFADLLLPFFSCQNQAHLTCRQVDENSHPTTFIHSSFIFEQVNQF